MKRFDSLVHVTRDGRWIDGRHDATYSHLIGELDRGEVDRACLVGLAGVIDNRYVMECARMSGGRLVPIAGINPTEYRGAVAMQDDCAQLAQEGFAGVKLHPRLHGYDPLGDACLQAIRTAADQRLVVFVDTLFRQRGCVTLNAADTIDRMVHASNGAIIVLLHGGGPALLEVAEVVRAHATLFLDLSFTMLRYAGTSLDLDIRWVMRQLDQRIVIGSDMPEYTPAKVFARALDLAGDISPEKWANMAHANLERVFSGKVWAAA